MNLSSPNLFFFSPQLHPLPQKDSTLPTPSRFWWDSLPALPCHPSLQTCYPESQNPGFIQPHPIFFFSPSKNFGKSPLLIPPHHPPCKFSSQLNPSFCLTPFFKFVGSLFYVWPTNFAKDWFGTKAFVSAKTKSPSYILPPFLQRGHPT